MLKCELGLISPANTTIFLICGIQLARFGLFYYFHYFNFSSTHFLKSNF